MNINRTIATLIATLSLLLPLSLAAKENPQRTEIKVQSSEKWWGLVVEPERVMLPFEGSFVVNTSEFSPTLYRANVLLSNRGRYLWSEEPFTVSFDGKQIVVSVSEGEAPKLQKSGRTLREAYLMCIHKNCPPTDIELTPLLFRNPIYELGGSEALLTNQESVLAFARTLKDKGVPNGTILLPLGWNSPTGALTFDTEAFDSPRAMIDSLHAECMQVMLTVTPYVMAAGRGYQLGRKEGRLLTNDGGEPVVFQTRLGYTACLDLTEPLIELMTESLTQLQTDYGVDGFYFDCLDALPLLEQNPTQLEEFLSAWHSIGSKVNVALYSTPRCNRYGNSASSVSTARHYTWDSLSESLERAIDASLLGFGHTSLAADLDFEHNNQELILRTAQLSAMLPVAIVPYSVWGLKDNAPLLKILDWRAQSGDYYLELARAGSSSAEPIVRHLEYQFPRTGFTNCRDEFMVGTRWLIAPVVNSAGVRMVRLPKGRWRDYESGRIFKGPRVIDANVADGKVAIFEKVD